MERYQGWAVPYGWCTEKGYMVIVAEMSVGMPHRLSRSGAAFNERMLRNEVTALFCVRLAHTVLPLFFAMNVDNCFHVYV